MSLPPQWPLFDGVEQSAFDFNIGSGQARTMGPRGWVVVEGL